HVHVGSQITSLEPLRRAAAFAAGIARELRDQGAPIEYVDLGGGLGVSYDGSAVPSPAEYVSALLEEVRDSGLPMVLEPGRAIAAPAGALLARVIDVKPRDAGSEFAVIDAGMTELLRPALYNAFHRVEPVIDRGNASRRYEVVGPVCESSDVVGRDRVLPQLAAGDLVAIGDAGAYGSVMASNYNRRPLPPEVLVDNGAWRVIRRRQTIDDQLAPETCQAFGVRRSAFGVQGSGFRVLGSRFSVLGSRFSVPREPERKHRELGNGEPQNPRTAEPQNPRNPRTREPRTENPRTREPRTRE